MTDSNDSFSDVPIVRIIIVDDDPIFRMGLRSWLKQYDDFQVIETISELALVGPRLQHRFAQAPVLPTVVILGGAMSSVGNQSRLIDCCRTIKTIYPSLRVLMVGPDRQETITSAQNANANGYALKTQTVDHLLTCLRQVAVGQFQWSTVLSQHEPDLEPNLSLTLGAKPESNTGTDPKLQADRIDDVPSSIPPASTPSTSSTSEPSGPFARLRFRLRVSGLEQIDAQLNQLLPQLNRLSNRDTVDVGVILDRWVMAGRCRELRAARWVVGHLLATPALAALDDASRYQEAWSRDPLVQWRRNLSSIARQPLYQATSDLRSTENQSRQTTPASPQTPISSQATQIAQTGFATPISPKEVTLPLSVRASVFDSVRDRLQFSLFNQTEHPLEIDILREEKKRELLVLVLHKVLTLLDDLRYSEVQPQQLHDRRSQLFYDLWQSILTDYFGKYYVVQIDGIEQEVVTILTQDARAVQASIFARIPFATDLLAHFLFESPLEIESVPYSLGTPEAFEQAEVLLDNLVIQMGNSVIQPLLNHLADVELIKQNFYSHQIISSRDIARFRNSLSWHYRRQQLIDEPTAIFESTYALLTVTAIGIKQQSIYASRRAELERLSGIPLIVTLLLEFRDALSPRLRGAIAAMGTAVIYVLTDVIGRAIGLIGRGILKGIGSAWHDFR